MADKYKWGTVTMLPDGHRIFPEDPTEAHRNESVRIAIADDSGREPQDTDDGVMWLDFTRNLSIHGGVNQTFQIPLINGKDDESRTISNASTLLMLSAMLEWPIEDRIEGAIYSVTKEDG